MKRSSRLSTDPAFILLLAFLFLIDVSIAACYVLATVILLLFLLHLLRGGPFPPLPLFCWFFLAYVFFTLLATVFSLDPGASFRDNKELLIFLLLPIYIWLLDSWKRVRLSLGTVLAAGAFSALAGIFSVAGKGIAAGVVLSDRLKGFTSHWMTYSGLLMLPFIFFAVRLMLRRGERKQTAMTVTALGLMLAAIAFSLTRNVWLGIALALGLFFVFFKPKYFLVLAPLLLVLVLLAPPAVRSRAFSIVDLQDSSNRDRIYMVYSGLKIFQDRPWTGVGSHNIQKVILGDERRYRHPQAERVNLHLHNNFLQILAERGIFALASFILACLSILLQLARRLKAQAGEQRAVTAGVLFAFIGFLAAGMFEYNFGDSEIKFLLFYFISLPFLTPVQAGQDGVRGEEHVQAQESL
ncbi:MAG: O-antigen ligase family protein [Acidobacteria bacterium]|jgi:O-antigen ligase|nr:O-antigen ligase family protein [Acidobacteriota bacterium]